MVKTSRLGYRSLWLLPVALGLSVLALTGCGGGGTTDTASTGGTMFPSSIPDVHQPEEWVSLIDAAGFPEYAALGRQLIANRTILLVSPPTLPENYNAYAFIPERRVWINSPMFTRYPNIVQQAAIFLHEMVHIKTGESTHNGEWWAIPDQFEAYWRSHPLSP